MLSVAKRVKKYDHTLYALIRDFTRDWKTLDYSPGEKKLTHQLNLFQLSILIENYTDRLVKSYTTVETIKWKFQVFILKLKRFFEADKYSHLRSRKKAERP